MEINIGLSPCPNDIFIFDALLHERIPLQGLRFRPVIEDVEQLNQKALQGTLDISKLSYHVIGKTLASYQILDSGSALGYNNGPILVSLPGHKACDKKELRIAIPGEETTANLLLGIFYPQATKKTAFLFSDIADLVVQGEQDAGLLIHESRFTYKKKGLIALDDLGAKWEAHEHLPIPLGGIAIKRSMPAEVITLVNELIRQSIEYAMQHPDVVAPAIHHYAQEKDKTVIQQHISMFVNNFSLSLGALGRESISRLFFRAREAALIPPYNADRLFSNQVNSKL